MNFLTYLKTDTRQLKVFIYPFGFIWVPSVLILCVYLRTLKNCK